MVRQYIQVKVMRERLDGIPSIALCRTWAKILLTGLYGTKVLPMLVIRRVSLTCKRKAARKNIVAQKDRLSTRKACGRSSFPGNMNVKEKLGDVCACESVYVCITCLHM